MAQVGKHHVTLGDESWEWDEKEMTLQDAFAIKAASGLNIVPFMAGINEFDPLAVQTLIWWLRHREGRTTGLSDVNFRLSDLAMVDVEDEPSPPASAVLDPVTSDTDETATSQPSHTSAI